MSHTGTPVASDMGMSNFMRTCLQVRMSRVSHEDASCLTKKCVTSHIGMSHVWLAVCCSVLQCVAVYCSVLQCVAVCCSMLLMAVYPDPV